MSALPPGQPDPLGATSTAEGTNFAVFSSVAERVELCLFDAQGRERRHDLHRGAAGCWHALLPEVGPGQRYGFRVHGPFEPGRGLLCSPSKLLLDPYARAVVGEVEWGPAVYAVDGDGAPLELDSAPFVPKSLVRADEFDWGRDRPPARPLEESVIYELHVKGFTARHPELPEALRGTYAGLAHPAVIGHLTKLGVTAVELLPIHHFVHDERLVELGLGNYWGYNSLAFFAPHAAYAADRRPGAAVGEFQRMVKALHAAGIEVLLDVVYNHTAEAGRDGPVLSFKGLDNAAYYHLEAEDPGEYVNVTGCGNSVDASHPQVLQLVMDSLRYWVREMHVDGFRFDLATTLARGPAGFDPSASFLDAVHQDPVLRQVKLIAEPWDVGEGGYRVGGFPTRWSEWNDQYRDCVRDFWRGEPHRLGEMASRLTGSSDLFEASGRAPQASINFVTAHDGFTLEDLVSYEAKRNEANGEENRDGTDDNRSWNCGHEGPTDDEAVLALRRRQKRNLLSTLLLSSGVPMLVAGDELGRTQAGNNNAYCQDGELSWLDWGKADAQLFDFARRLVALRRAHPVLQGRGWFRGRVGRRDEVHNVAWFQPEGELMEDEHWTEDPTAALGVFWNGAAIPAPGAAGARPSDASFLLLLNATPERLAFRVPDASFGDIWTELLDTAREGSWVDDAPRKGAGEERELEARSLVLLQREQRAEGTAGE